ncbi:ABC transporter ATP-binding protein [Paenibacillus xylanexedens]|uniref:ABC transporter ATP-binding protein n=1 Tax=Paenibacillus xylanexedens TaxID=528191 RepID=UPI003CFD38A7
MEQNISIRFENVNKMYKLYARPIDRLKEAINPFSKKRYKEYYALKNINMSVYRGETLGIIGRNGSGKSTLLKIMTGVLSPTSGNVEVNGKVSALLELGTGFNPEYTGIENIYMNGLIFGLSREEMDEKLQGIIDFADIGEYLYQPVKMYSSGMFVRLAFAVQTCIEPEILIVDEALAVGDAKFANKCIDHMKKIVEKGATVILVTHDVQQVKSFCDRVIWLNQGEFVAEGDPRSITSKYTRFLFEDTSIEEALQENKKIETNIDEFTQNEELIVRERQTWAERAEYTRWGQGGVKVEDFLLKNELDIETSNIDWGEEIELTMTVKAEKDINSDRIGFGFSFRNRTGIDVIVSTTIEEGKSYGPFKKNEEYRISFRLRNILAEGEYLVTLQIEDRTNVTPVYYEFIENAMTIQVFSEQHIYSLVKPPIEQIIRKTR